MKKAGKTTAEGENRRRRKLARARMEILPFTCACSCACVRVRIMSILYILYCHYCYLLLLDSFFNQKKYLIPFKSIIPNTPNGSELKEVTTTTTKHLFPCFT